MKNHTFIAELHTKLGAPSSETVQSLRLLRAFLRLTPGQRIELIEMIEHLTSESHVETDRPLS